MHLYMKYCCESDTSTRPSGIYELFVSSVIKNNLRAWYQLVKMKCEPVVYVCQAGMEISANRKIKMFDWPLMELQGK